MQIRTGFSVCTALLALSLPLFAGAQTPAAPTAAASQTPRSVRRAEARVRVSSIPINALVVGLRLSKDQENSLTQIQEKARTDMQALRPAPGAAPDPDASRKLGDVRRQQEADMMAVLTPDQREKLPALFKQVSTLTRVGLPARAVNDLKLTDDQTAKLDQIGSDTREKIMALPLDQRRTQARDMIRAAREQAMAVLTADQKAVVEKYTPARGANRTAAAPAP